jgi:hypothetical protein
MVFIADRVVIYECTKPTSKGKSNSIHPLTEYLRRGKPLTPILREWIVSLLEVPTSGDFRLEYKQRPGNRPTDHAIQRNILVFSRFGELNGKRITHQMYKEYQKTLEINPNHADEVSLVIGARLSREQAYEMIGAEFASARATVKKVILKIEKAILVD